MKWPESFISIKISSAPGLLAIISSGIQLSKADVNALLAWVCWPVRYFWEAQTALVCITKTELHIFETFDLKIYYPYLFSLAYILGTLPWRYRHFFGAWWAFDFCLSLIIFLDREQRSVSMPAPGSHYSQWKLSNILLFKQKSECVVQLKQYETDMARWHGAIHSCLGKKEAFGKAGREKGIASILARHEASAKRPLKNTWGVEKRKEQEDGMRCTEVWWEVWTKTCRDLVWSGNVSTLLRPWILWCKSEVQWAALLPLESHFTSPPLRFSPHLFLLIRSASIKNFQERGKRKRNFSVTERWDHGTWVKRWHDSVWFRRKR